MGAGLAGGKCFIGTSNNSVATRGFCSSDSASTISGTGGTTSTGTSITTGAAAATGSATLGASTSCAAAGMAPLNQLGLDRRRLLHLCCPVPLGSVPDADWTELRAMLADCRLRSLLGKSLVAVPIIVSRQRSRRSLPGEIQSPSKADSKAECRRSGRRSQNQAPARRFPPRQNPLRPRRRPGKPHPPKEADASRSPSMPRWDGPAARS